MLKVFRQNTKVIIWITVTALALLFGAGSIVDLVGGKKSGRFAGEVFGKTVSFQEYNRFYLATQVFMPSEKPVEDPDLLREYTWQNIIYAREARKEGIKISDTEVQEEITKILKEQGLVSPTTEQYKIWLTRSLRVSPREFEEGLREFLRIQKLLRVKIASFTPAGIADLKDEKAKTAADEKQKGAFLNWTTDVNKRAALKDYLALPQGQEETPETYEETTPVKTTPEEKPAPALPPAPVAAASAPVAEPPAAIPAAPATPPASAVNSAPVPATVQTAADPKNN